MIGKLIGGTVKIILKAIHIIPFIGPPLVNTIIFILDNLFSLIKKLPYIIGGTFVIACILILMGVI